MFRNKMRQAREHVRAREYDEARAVLKTVDHPQAREWESKIDVLEHQHKSQQKARESEWQLILPLVLLGLVIVAGGIFLLRGILAGDDSAPAEGGLPAETATLDPRPPNVPVEFPFPDNTVFTVLWDRSNEDIVHVSGYSSMLQEGLYAFYAEALIGAGYAVRDFSRNELVNLSFVGNEQAGTVRIDYDAPGSQARVTIRIELDAE